MTISSSNSVTSLRLFCGVGVVYERIHAIRRVELAAYADCQAFTAVLIQNVQRPEDPSIVVLKTLPSSVL